MACPSCGHRLQNIGVCHPPYEQVPIFWCPNCGTLKANIVTEEDEAPKLLPEMLETYGDGMATHDPATHQPPRR